MVIAKRTLVIRLEQYDKNIDVRLFAPVPHDDSWDCSYEIDWPEGTQQMTTGGFDAIQAILGALQMIGADIYTSDYHKAGMLRWGKQGEGFGFPVTSNLRELLEGNDVKFF